MSSKVARVAPPCSFFLNISWKAKTRLGFYSGELIERFCELTLVRFVANGRSRSLRPIVVNTAVVSDGRVAPDETPEGLIGGNKRMQRAADRPMRTRRLLVHDPLALPPLRRLFRDFAAAETTGTRTRGRVLSRGAVTRDANERNDLDRGGAFARPGARRSARAKSVTRADIEGSKWSRSLVAERERENTKLRLATSFDVITRSRDIDERRRAKRSEAKRSEAPSGRKADTRR